MTPRPTDSTAAAGLRVLPRCGREARVVSNELGRHVLGNSALGERARGNRTVDVARVGLADVRLPRSGRLGSADADGLEEVALNAITLRDRVLSLLNPERPAFSLLDPVIQTERGNP
jgi:hypothetical protein